MQNKLKNAHVTFTGIKPLLFDRYAGNEAKLEPIEKVYWSQDGLAVIPQINVYSALSAENSKSVCKMFFGKKAKPIGMAINNCLVIKQEELLITRDGEPFSVDEFDKDFEVVHHVARINKSGTAIPNPKERPKLPAPWQIDFDITFMPSGDLNWQVMQECFGYAGVIGLGTYRPLFGGFKVEID